MTLRGKATRIATGVAATAALVLTAIPAQASVTVTTSSKDAKTKLQEFADGHKSPVERYHEYLNLRAPKNAHRGAFAGTLSPAEEYIQFKTQDEAFAWYNDFAPIFAQLTNTEVVPLVLPTDAKYAAAYKRLQTGVHKLWLSYVDLFPEQTAGLSEPPIILRKTDEVNAFVTRDFNTDRIVHAININTGIVDLASITDEELFGVIGHELAHSVFRHALPKYQARVNKFYDRTTFKGKYSYEAKNDAGVTEIVSAWMDHASSAGDISIDQLQDLPAMGVAGPIYLKIMIKVVKAIPTCQALIPDVQALLDLQTYDTLSSQFSVATSAVPKVDVLSSRIRRSLADCTAGKKISLAKILSAMTGLPEDVITQKLPQEDMSAFDGAADVGGGIVAATHLHRVAQRDLEAKFPIDHAGAYTFEEHADDIGTIVLSHAGFDATKFGPFFLEFMKADAPALSRCNQMIASHQQPPQGTFSDPHRATCYRADHIEKLAAEPEFKADVKAFAAKFLTATWSQSFLQ